MALVSRWMIVFSAFLHAISKQVYAMKNKNIHHRWSKILTSEFEIAIPFHADKDGNFLSHDLVSAHREHGRKRRDTFHDRPEEDPLHIRIHSSKSNFHLHLTPSHGFLSQSFKIHRRKTSIEDNGAAMRETVVEEPEVDVMCFYAGTIARMEHSSAAVSVCDGLMGFVSTATDHYIIEPLPPITSLVNMLPQELNNHTEKPVHNHTFPAAYNQTSSSHIRKLKNKIKELHEQNSYLNSSNKTETFTHHIIYRHDWSPKSSLSTQEVNAIPGSRYDLREHSCVQGKEYESTFAFKDNYLQSDKAPSSHYTEHLHQSKDKFQEISGSGKNSTSQSYLSYHKSRRRRSFQFNSAFTRSGWANKSHSVETIVVIDNAMIRNHGEQNVTIYALTLLNMMHNLFHDKTIGNKINFTILALILLEGDEMGLVLNEKADQTLNNFCHWQSNLKGLHHDHAILLTGVDICSFNGQYCDTLGFAPIEGMCKRFLSCTINEDNGLGTAFTITHEAGHNFGMRHDGDDNHCTDLTGSIMAPRIQGDKGVFKWSACSRRYLDKFLSSSQAWCLEDEPRQLSQLQFPDKLPGELYDADIQCKWQFGPRSRLCTYDFATDLCASLWCHTGGLRCETKFLPAAEGTSCGYLRWCRKGLCVEYGDEGPKPVEGQWSGWSPWTTCTRSCAGGVMFRHRACNRPRPQYGGGDCVGEGRMYKMCNVQACPEGEAHLRAEQCSVYDVRPFRGHVYTWEPYTNIYEEKDQCKLFCRDSGRKIYYEMNHRVEDGTPCLINPAGVCVDGECRTVGCDNVIGSTAQLDQCGVCGGDNSTCQVISGTISSYFSPNYYHYVMRIPEHARSVSVAELTRSPSYIAIRNSAGVYYLNGNWRVSWPGKSIIAGCMFDYQRPYNGPEKITSLGPLNQPLIFEILALRETPTIVYSYTIPRAGEAVTQRPPQQHNYTWSVSESQCSASCASGEKVTSAKCLRDHLDEMDFAFCDLTTKPFTGVVSCNNDPCPPEWVSSDWSDCSKECGGGIQKRKVACMQVRSANHTVKVRSHLCRHLPKPSRRQRCNKHECPPEWHVGRWTECSETCGIGTRRRQVVCRSQHHKLPHHYCATSLRPHDSERCQMAPCFANMQWYLSQWSSCSTTCGKGIRTRILRCSGENQQGKFEILPAEKCRYLERPMLPLQELCEERACDVAKQPKWFVSPWSQCSVTCGQGNQIRLLRCLDGDTAERTDGCSDADKPSTQQDCDTQISCTASVVVSCRDEWHMCSLVPKNNLCHHRYYGRQCCASCQGHPSSRLNPHG